MLKFFRKLIVLMCMISCFPTNFIATSPAIDDSALDNVEKAGTYPVKFTYRTAEGEEVTTTAYITVTYLRTVIIDKEAIDAADLEMEKEAFLQLTYADLIELANAHAWSTIDGHTIAVTGVVVSDIDKITNTCHVTFSTDNKTSTTIVVVLKQKIVEEGTNYSYFSVGEAPYVWWGISIIFSFVLLPLLVLAFVFIISKKRTKEIDELLHKTEKKKNRVM